MDVNTEMVGGGFCVILFRISPLWSKSRLHCVVAFHRVSWLAVLQKTSCLYPSPAVHSQATVNDSRWVHLGINADTLKAQGPGPRYLFAGVSAFIMATLLTIVAVLAVLSGGLCEEKTFLQRAGVAFNSRQYRSLLTVSNGEQFGKWTWPEMCPEDFFAVGFSIRVKTLHVLLTFYVREGKTWLVNNSSVWEMQWHQCVFSLSHVYSNAGLFISRTNFSIAVLWTTVWSMN